MNAPDKSAVLAPTVKLLINGQLVESKTTQWRDVVNPATQEVLARVPFATPDEINAAVAMPRKRSRPGRRPPSAPRPHLPEAAAADPRKHEGAGRLLTAEQGKTLPDAEGDVFRGLEVVEHAASIGNLQLGELANNVANGVDTYTLLQPLGVCAGITPFNFPAMIPLWMFPMAIATATPSCSSPPSRTPWSPCACASWRWKPACPLAC
jgi:malonate-semialdehyde dehydrogenase (acetylating)/methylmalonate-semialdehyde dehydrogenase